MKSPEEQLETLSRGVVDFVSPQDLLERLRESAKTGRPLRVKVGFDPTRPDLHLGHTVVMNKMRQFQELGHEVVFVVGDFTAAIGDPSGRNKTRPPLSREDIVAGAESYAEQAFKILDRERTRIAYNGTWLGPMGFADVVRLAGKYTLARMMERQDFKMRWEEGQSISIHELLYPLAQAQDSVHLECDVEMGGTDQLFNLMVGRDLMKESGQKPQIVMTTPILEGLSARWEVGEDGKGRIVGDKMSKSLDNYVGIAEPPATQVGKLMSIGDELMWRYYELLSSLSSAEIAARKAGAMSPRDAKMALAVEIVTLYHGAEAAAAAKAGWEKQFSRGEVPDDIAEIVVESAGEPVPLVKALVTAGLAASNSEARRKIDEGAVKTAAGDKLGDSKGTLPVGRHVLKLGRKWAAIVVR